jgi:phage gp36-like protein
MAYLIPYDYHVSIQDANIQQIISNDESIRTRAQLAAEAEAQSYLKQKYDISREFQDLLPFSFSKTYKAFERFYLTAAAYVSATTYNLNDLTLFSGAVYIATATTTGTFDPSKWTKLGQQFDIFSVIAPYPEFDFSGYYSIGNQVFWKNKTYTCRVKTAVLDHDTALQYRVTENLPYPNVPPDDPLQGVSYWGEGVNYNVTGQLPTNTTYFTKSDNRDQQMVLYLCDIVLFHLHTRIAPRNIPELRIKRYESAIEWLRMCAEGSVTPNLPLIKPKQGNRIRFGGNVRQINSY